MKAIGTKKSTNQQILKKRRNDRDRVIPIKENSTPVFSKKVISDVTKSNVMFLYQKEAENNKISSFLKLAKNE